MPSDIPLAVIRVDAYAVAHVAVADDGVEPANKKNRVSRIARASKD